MQKNTKLTHITNIKSGDIVIHNGQTKTVCKNDITNDDFMGVCLFGDSYKLGNTLVEVVQTEIERAQVWHSSLSVNDWKQLEKKYTFGMINYHPSVILEMWIKEGKPQPEKNIHSESLEQIESWLDRFSLRSLTENNLPSNTVSFPDIPYNYHELYAELVRRSELTGEN